jgi:hypothetical protein
MSRPARQVRTVRLSAPSAPLIRRGALLLEDALHTASLPDAGAGRLLVVRSLACGPIRAGQSPASLALTIEQRMQQLSATAIDADETTAATALAVTFRDAVEPYVRLALRLARHEPTRAWFWPLAVPGWTPALPRDEALRLILAGAIETAPGVAAVARLVRELHERDALPAMLAALRWQDGPALLRASGWAQPLAPFAAHDPAPDALEIGPSWRGLLDQWRGWWGAEDARTIWLAHIALVAERPARLLDARLTQRAQRLLRQLAAPAIDAPTAPPADAQPIDPPVAPRQQSEPPHSQHDQAIEATARAETEPAAPADAIPASATERQRPTEPIDAPADAEQRWSGLPQRSAYAGLFFALAALERLGIAALLEQQPELIELNLPDLLLAALARQVGCPAADPALLALAERSPLRPTVQLSWVAAPSWRTLLDAPVLLLVRRVGAAHALFDSSGRLPLALWRGRAPAELHALVAGAELRRGSALPAQPDLDLLVRAWLAALRRWCRRYAGLGLLDLVHRPGRVAATRTHLDILFDHRQADLRVRRAGLDLDPGWLPWLGRVVAFHYLYGEL